MNKIKQQSQGSIGKPTDVTHKLHVDFGVRIHLSVSSLAPLG